MTRQTFTLEPPSSCYTDALNHYVVSASNIPNEINAMKRTLSNGFPFVVGIQIFESFESFSVTAPVVFQCRPMKTV